ncbi:MAG TPA: nickel-dependent lactate racemase [Nitrolancea sp.]|jgi:nickel-dependent lactate racemase|nr:nickel-dependent lactate racemase [Nitrolancea sp.]
MTVVHMPYDTGDLIVELPDDAVIADPPITAAVEDARLAVRAALEQPIESARLREIARDKQSATIVINDVTRPCPTQLLVEELLVDLADAGLTDDQISLLVATGNHRPNSAEELCEMLGAELVARLRVVNHDGTDPDQLVLLGQTPGGVPLEVNRLVVDTDLTILTGIVTPHQTAGFSGGRKSIMPGVASEFALRTHHSPPIRSLEPVMGVMENNVFHAESLAAARMVGVDFIINVVKNQQGGIVAVVAGDLDAAHRAGVAICDAAWRVQLRERADISIVSPGGYPKDIDLHQAQKAVSAAEQITRRGGPIILVAKCRVGTSSFASALIRAESPQAMVDEFLQEGFRGNEHTSKAYMYARALLKHPLIVVTDQLEPDLLAQMFMHWAPNVEQALAMARDMVGPNPKIVAVPHAVDCLLSVGEPVPVSSNR